MAQASVQALSASSGGVFSPRQAVFERREVRILGYYTETVGREKRSPPAGPSSFLGEGRYFLLKQEMLYLHTCFQFLAVNATAGELFVNASVYRDRTVVLHHHAVSLVAKHVSENQEVELFALLFSG